jgi:hypothetical protein
LVVEGTESEGEEGMTECYDDPQPNIPLLRKAVEWVEEQEALPWIDRNWWQGDYYVDPLFWATIMVCTSANGKYRTASAQRRAAQLVAPHCGSAYCVAGKIGADLDERYATSQVVDGVHVAAVAREALGLDDGQAQLLFAGSNKAADIRRLAEEFAGQPL